MTDSFPKRNDLALYAKENQQPNPACLFFQPHDMVLKIKLSNNSIYFLSRETEGFGPKKSQQPAYLALVLIPIDVLYILKIRRWTQV